METKCPDCRARFIMEELEYDHGDLLNCPECNLELVALKGKKRLKIRSSKEHFLEKYEDEFIDEETELL